MRKVRNDWALWLLVTLLGLAAFCNLAAQTVTPPHPVPAIQDVETKAQRDQRMAWWRAARFGMFIHWGTYAVPAGRWNGKEVKGPGEWIMYTTEIPVADYQKLPAQFNPTKFDADAWVALAIAAGMKYIVITTKHHEGFAMFKSAASRYNIVDDTPYRRDVLQQLAQAAHRQGLKLGFYYSQDQDWTAPGGAALGHGHWNPAQDGDFATYLHTKAIPQLKELLSNYGEFPDVIWFDSPTKDMTPQLASEIVALVNQHPKLIWNNRLGGGYPGDTETPEQEIPPRGFPGRDWETCMTINDTWGFKKDDTNFKSTQTLLLNLIDIASKGGNYLLNVGPDATGVIPPPEAERLQAIGRWLKLNGDAIYGTGPTPFGAEDGAFSDTQKDANRKPVWIPKWDWRATTKPGRIYISIFKWPQGALQLPAVAGRITKSYLLPDAQQRPLKFSQTEAGTTVELPASAPDKIASVVVLETAE